MTEHAGELERLGETQEWGELMLHLLQLQGWTVTVRPLFSNSGVLVLAERDRVIVYRKGDSIADVACELFLDAANRTDHTRRTSVSSPAPAAR